MSLFGVHLHIVALMFFRLEKEVVVKTDDDHWVEWRELEHGIIYALIPSEQRVGLSDCEEVRGTFSNRSKGDPPHNLTRPSVSL